MRSRSGPGTVLLGGLVTLAGAAAAAVAVTVVAVAAPGAVVGPGFYWTSSAAAVVLHGVLGLVGGRIAARRLDGPGDGAARFHLLVCAGPVLATVVTQAGALGDGRAPVALAALGAACVGALTGGWSVARRSRTVP
ncbi:hypothetical protein Acsp04_01790 [Actinomadura sp. NBRC 104425]|uniref:hypothetical protein n=1 Tax=Actinomadura sp. NBRC 104425 TaxID=3032204 RepID=UPI0024A1A1F4|nr:hypothetical protein [Actinomadura sp. NBRC 104425]GLZ09944.1 hypothetical protein Acsp04_01790 [Actinomadura sp. NBRC 104425]